MLIDTYNLKARQAPVTVALAPAVLAALATVPSLQGVWGFLGGVVVTLGLPYAFAQSAGTAGKNLEPGLYASWGGMPSVTMLRHRDSRIDRITKRSYFEVLRDVGITMPTAENEQADPAAAEESYEAASAWLRKETRDAKAYPRVKTELTNYGLARNLLGVKWLGLGAALIVSFIQAGLLILSTVHGTDVAPFLILSLGFGVIMVGFWSFVVRPGWARRAAEAYALALLEACDRRKAPKATKPTSGKRPSGTKDKVAPSADDGAQPTDEAAPEGVPT